MNKRDNLAHSYLDLIQIHSWQNLNSTPGKEKNISKPCGIPSQAQQCSQHSMSFTTLKVVQNKNLSNANENHLQNVHMCWSLMVNKDHWWYSLLICSLSKQTNTNTYFIKLPLSISSEKTQPYIRQRTHTLSLSKAPRLTRPEVLRFHQRSWDQKGHKWHS